MTRSTWISLFAVTLLMIPHVWAKRKSATVKPDLASVLTTTAPPEDLEVCFSPVEHCDAKLIKFIQSAEESLDIAIFDINHEQLVHQVLLQQTKKLKVRVLVDKRQAKGPHSLVSLLVKGGVDLRYGRQRGVMHNKFTVVDGKRVETGSFNYTNHATEANSENQIYLSAPAVVTRYKDQFDKIWREGTPITAPRTLSSE